MAATTPVSPKPVNPKIERLPAFAGILREHETFSSVDDVGLTADLNSSFDRLVLQSGVEMSASLLTLLCFSSGLVMGASFFVLTDNLLVGAIGAGIGAILPIVFTAVIRAQRQKLIMAQMPPMVDELSRAAKTGRSLEQCLELVAQDTPAPLGSELRLCVKKLAMGIGVPQALADLPARTGIVSMNVFTMALTVHQQTGGDLVTVMDRLARTIRDRISFLGRLRAATAASRAAALLMIGLPPAIVTFFAWRDPNYFNELFASPWGRTMTFVAIALQIIGAAVVLRILRTTARS
jgi:tight adherence protein B